VAHLARTMDRPLLVRRPSDLLGAYVGETEKAIAQAFERAPDERAVLLLDEADTFLQDRRTAMRSWEVSQVNELLQQLESFPGVVAATTNLMRELDQASLRRFAFKIPFDYLRADQADRLLRGVLGRMGVEAGPESEAAVVEVRGMARLTPGDFAAVGRRVGVMGGGAVTAMGVVRELREEVRVKGGGTGRVGFGV
jgi:transitional endoplasmic reticulum ATPase